MSKAAFEIAMKELGTAEIFGDSHRNGGDNSRIVEYHAATRLRATSDEVPWCASFVNWCLKKATIDGTNSARARSFLTWGVAVSLEEAQRGDIIVLSRGTNAQFGHVVFLPDKKANPFWSWAATSPTKLVFHPIPFTAYFR